MLDQDQRVRQLVIGYAGSCYGSRRVSCALPVRQYGIRYRRIHRLPFHRLPGAPPYWVNLYRFYPKPSVDVVHLFNGICRTDVPWISSIEMEYPRYFGKVSPSAIEHAYQQMAKDECRLLLPMSHAAKRYFLRRAPAQYRDCIEQKVCVFTGGVSVPESALYARQQYLSEKHASFRVGFVGKAFWRKGAPAVIDGIRELRTQSYDVRLVVIGDPMNRDYVVWMSDCERRRMCDLMKKTPWIEWYQELPNHQLMEKMARFDVLVFPTLDESLGWVVIEAKGLGVPVVTTNAFALPELVRDGEDGRIIELPLDCDRRWKGLKEYKPSERRTKYDLAIRIQREGIVQAITEFIENRCLCETMGRNARQRYVAEYDEQVVARKLAVLLHRTFT